MREQNFVVSTGINFYNKSLDLNTMSEINNSHLFIGLITGKSTERNRVLEEWHYAVSRNIPNLLLIEDTVPVQENFTGNYLRFNRTNPQQAIDEINKRMLPTQIVQPKDSNDIVPWILGGAALLTIIGLLSNDKSTKTKKPSGKTTKIAANKVRAK